MKNAEALHRESLENFARLNPKLCRELEDSIDIAKGAGLFDVTHRFDRRERLSSQSSLVIAIIEWLNLYGVKAAFCENAAIYIWWTKATMNESGGLSG